MHAVQAFLARRTLVTLKKIKRLKIIPAIFICGFPGPRRIIQKAPQLANVEEAPAWRQRQHCASPARAFAWHETACMCTCIYTNDIHAQMYIYFCPMVVPRGTRIWYRCASRHHCNRSLFELIVRLETRISIQESDTNAGRIAFLKQDPSFSHSCRSYDAAPCLRASTVCTDDVKVGQDCGQE